MPRPIEYDKAEVLNNVLGAFWKKGFSGCSIQTLVDATGMSRQSLYNLFGNKDHLFRAAILHYTAMLREALIPLDARDGDLMCLRRFIENTLQIQIAMGPGACFLVITAFAEQANDPQIKEVVDHGAEMVRKKFESILTEARKRGRCGIEPAIGAGYLYSMMNGLSALIRTGADERQIKTMLDFTFSSIELPGVKNE